MNGDFSRYNDYELIYLVNEGVEEVLDLMIWKYSFLIHSRLSYFGVSRSRKDEYYQEGCLTLLKAIKTFDDRHNYPFTKYFDLLLKRRIISLIKKDKVNSIDYIDDFDFLESIEHDSTYVDFEKELLFLSLTPFEEEVYRGFFIDYLTAGDIAYKLDCDSKSVSNAKQRIIKKLKHSLSKQ